MTFLAYALSTCGVLPSGFKLFSRDSIRVLFGSLHLERWAFDLEIVYLADRLGLPMMVKADVTLQDHDNQQVPHKY